MAARRRRLLIVSAGILVLLVSAILIRGGETAPDPVARASAAPETAPSEAPDPPELRVRSGPGKPPVDPATLANRFDPAGRERFAAMRPSKQADETAEILRDEAKVFDRALPEQRRAAALERLAGRGALSPEVAASMAEMMGASDEVSVRAGLSQSARSRLDHPVLVEALLARLASDPHEMVRKRAAQSLGGTLGDPRVRQSLERAREADASPFVRDAVKAVLEPVRMDVKR